MSEENQKKDQTPARNNDPATASKPAENPKLEKSSDVKSDSAPKPSAAAKPAPDKTPPRPASVKKEAAMPIETESSEESGPIIWPLWVVILIIIITLGGGGYYVWSQFQGLAAFKQELKQAQSQGIQSSDEELSALKSELSTLSGSLNSTSQNLSMKQHELQTRLTQTANQMLQIGGTTRTEWLLAEAEYLLRLANQRLNFEKDVPGALAILQAADLVLNESGDAGIYGVREQLKKETLALEGQALVDRDGIYLELEAIIGLVEKLDQKVFASEPDAETGLTHSMAAADSTPEDAAQWEKWWSKLKRDLAPMVVFRKLDKPVEPLLSPEQSYYLKQNLRLMLEQSQLALMKRNQSLYEKSLTKAGEWINTYFLRSNTHTELLLNKLKTLESRNVNPDVPDISQSLLLLKERIAVLYRRGNTGATSGSEG